MLGFIPGLLHAWYIIAKFPEADPAYEPVDGGESGVRGERVTYYFITGSNGEQIRRERQLPGGYGTNEGMRAEAPRPEGERSSGGVPPTYAEAVKGDHKVQT